MSCKDCPHWGANASQRLKDTQEWMDCNYLVGKLEPRLFECRGIAGKKFSHPFDPHDFKYFKFDENFLKLYKGAAKRDQKKGVRVHIVSAKDSTFQKDDYGHITSKVQPVKLYYFQTHKDFNCKRKEE